MVTAKFKVTKVEGNEVYLEPVIYGSKENEEFWKYTPAGRIHMHIDNDTALEQFEEGKECYVDFRF